MRSMSWRDEKWRTQLPPKLPQLLLLPPQLGAAAVDQTDGAAQGGILPAGEGEGRWSKRQAEGVEQNQALEKYLEKMPVAEGLGL